MLVERRILVAILKGTLRESNVNLEDIFREARVPRTTALKVLNALHREGCLSLEGDKISVSKEQRLKIVFRAVKLGSDVEETTRFLTWSEFESFSKLTFESSGFNVITNFRFVWLKKRWEVDVIGVKKPIVIAADCKHWCKRWSGSASVRAVKSQIERTKALAEASRLIKDKIGLSEWKYAYFVPVVLSLFPSQYKFYERTPIVPVLQLKDFIENTIVHLEEICHFFVDFSQSHK